MKKLLCYICKVYLTDIYMKYLRGRDENPVLNMSYRIVISTPELCLNDRMNELMKERSNLCQRFIYAR